MLKNLINRNLVGAFALIFLTTMVVAAAYYKSDSKTTETPYIEFTRLSNEGKVREVILTDDAKLRFYIDGEEAPYTTDNPRNPLLKQELLMKGIAVREGSYMSAGSLLQNALGIMFFGAMLFMVYRGSRRSPLGSAMAMNPSDANENDTKVITFGDISGNTEAKESVSDIVDFIKNPEKYTFYGARIPRGVILYGPPGTGKTLMARAVAGETGVPFYAVSGSDFVQMYVGVGASRIRELFAKARKSGKAVIFVDEIDALGKKRSQGIHGANDEREQTLNALLTEMSGFSDTDGIVVIAATNRIDTLDEALLRPGRFDRQIEIGLPDLNARRDILSLHLKGKPVSEEVDVESLARDTVYFSGAMIESLLNEAAIYAAKRTAEKIEVADIDKAYYTVIAGSEKSDRSGIKEHERILTAYHESGHALVSYILQPQNTLSRITIIPSTKGAGGFCVNIPPDRLYQSKKDIEAQIMVYLAGRASEEIVFGEDEITTGAANDLEKATQMIRDYVCRYGMSPNMGLLSITGMGISESKQEAEGYILECRNAIDKLYAKTRILLSSRREELNRIADNLLEKETLNGEDLEMLLSNVNL